MTLTIKNLLIAAMYIFLISSPTVFSAETNITEIHTPEFPKYLEMMYGEGVPDEDKLMKYFELINEFFNLANKNSTYNALLSNESIKEKMEEISSILQGIGDYKYAEEIRQLINYSNLDIEQLIQSIGDESLKNILNEVTAGSTQVNDALSLISKMYSAREISFDDYLKSLNILKKVTNNSDISSIIDSSLMNILMKSLINSTLNIIENPDLQTKIIKQNLTKEALESMIEFLERAPQENRDALDSVKHVVGVGNASAVLSPLDFRVPQLSGFPALQSIVFESSILIISLLTVSSIIFFMVILNSKKFKSAIIRVNTLIRKDVNTSNLPHGVVRIYWDSVNILSTKVGRSINETHREYCERIRALLPEAHELFKHIALAYEKVRWGHYPDRLFLDDVFRNYKELERLIIKG